MYIVWDDHAKMWCENVVSFQDDDLASYTLKNKNLIRRNDIYEFKALNNDRYTVFNDISLFDKEAALIYEGHIIQVAENIIGVIIYYADLGSYLFFDYNNSKFTFVTKELCEASVIVGHVAEEDGRKLLNGLSTLDDDNFTFDKFEDIINDITMKAFESRMNESK